jgi:hypothetical protein
MIRRSTALLILIVGAGCSGRSSIDSTAGTGNAPPALTVEEAKGLLPEAAGMSRAEAEALYKTPTATDKPNKSLTLLILALRPPTGASAEAAVKEFRFLEEGIPNPSKLAFAMEGSQKKGYFSVIRPEYITDCTCKTDGSKATGTVSFKAKDVYEGKIEYSAQYADGKWRVVEFRLPAYGIATTLNKDGVWKETGKNHVAD